MLNVFLFFCFCFYYFLLQKIRNAIQPDIFECKICGEHNCEHDTHDMHSVQEMLAIYPTQTQPHIILQAAPPGRHAAANTAVTKNGNHLNLDKNLVQ